MNHNHNRTLFVTAGPPTPSFPACVHRWGTAPMWGRASATLWAGKTRKFGVRSRVNRVTWSGHVGTKCQGTSDLNDFTSYIPVMFVQCLGLWSAMVGRNAPDPADLRCLGFCTVHGSLLYNGRKHRDRSYHCHGLRFGSRETEKTSWVWVSHAIPIV